jgi:hypothetical protein
VENPAGCGELGDGPLPGRGVPLTKEKRLRTYMHLK